MGLCSGSGCGSDNKDLGFKGELVQQYIIDNALDCAFDSMLRKAATSVRDHV